MRIGVSQFPRPDILKRMSRPMQWLHLQPRFDPLRGLFLFLTQIASSCGRMGRPSGDPDWCGTISPPNQPPPIYGRDVWFFGARCRWGSVSTRFPVLSSLSDWRAPGTCTRGRLLLTHTQTSPSDAFQHDRHDSTRCPSPPTVSLCPTDQTFPPRHGGTPLAHHSHHG